MNHLDAWLLVGHDIVVVLRWPVMCVLWGLVGCAINDDQPNFGVPLILAFALTLFNGLVSP